MSRVRMSYGDAVLVVDGDQLMADAPATGKGFSDLVVLAAMAHEKWKVEIEGIDVSGEQ